MNQVSAPHKSSLIALVIWALGTLFWWGLAFFPTPLTNPEWLNVARKVCFGALENGLPNAAGWMVLILGPLSFLIAHMVMWPKEIPAWMRQLWGLPHIMGKVLIAIFALAFFMEGAWTYNKVKQGLEITNFDYSNPTAEELPDTYPRTRLPASEFSLVDQAGKTVTLASLRGKTVVLTFAFAHCQTICPTLVSDCLAGIRDFSSDKVELLIVTLDPWRDTPQSLPFLAEKWKLPEIARVLSGEVEDVTKLLDAYKVPYQRNENTGDVTHPALVYIIDAEGNIAYTFNNAPASWLRKAVENLKYEKKTVGSRRQTRSHIQSTI